eukprot:jgi/Chlat1/2420/Chrsp17S02668
MRRVVTWRHVARLLSGVQAAPPPLPAEWSHLSSCAKSLNVAAASPACSASALWQVQKRCNPQGPRSFASLIPFKLAQTGEGIAECELIRWFVKPGDKVREFDKVCEVQSDKASIEITSRYAGTIRALHHNTGDIVKVGATLVDIEPPVTLEATQDPLRASPAASSPTPRDHYANEASDMQPPPPLTRQQSASLATPAVRSMCKELNVNLEDVVGTGRDGRIMKEDVLRYRNGLQQAAAERTAHDTTSTARSTLNAHPPPVSTLPPTPPPRLSAPVMTSDTEVPLRGYARIMAKTMAASTVIPHFTFCDEVHVDNLIALREALKADPTFSKSKLTFLPIMIKALSIALRAFPGVNATVDEECTKVTHRGSHNIGVAMDTPHGLVVPNIKDCQSKSLPEIAAEMARLQALAASNSLPPHDVSGGTITISNIGTLGGTYATPIINRPEVAIIAFGKIRRVPRFDEDGEVVPASIMQVSMSADHRVVDGATIARLANEWKGYLESPEKLLLYMR